MRRWHLVGRVASEASLSKATAKKAVDAVFGAIEDCLGNDEPVSIERFGRFWVRERSERPGRNPRTGEPLVIEAAKVPTFKPAKALRESVGS